MKKAVEFIFEQELPHWRQKKMLLAHSGGLDSSVLAHLLVEMNCNIAVAHCNFQLRGADSEGDQEWVQQWCQQHKIPFYTQRFVLPKGEGSIQLNARQLRYDWFDALQEIYEFEVLLTAHHLNDQLETFLMHAGRGTGLTGLLGIPSSPKRFRPLRSISKATIKAYAKEHKLIWREDVSNASTAYTRNAIRHKVVAPLLTINPQFLSHFNTTLAHLNDTQGFVEVQLAALRQKIFKPKKEYIEIDLKKLNTLPQLSFCLHAWFMPLGFHHNEVQKLLTAQTGSALSSVTHQLIRNRDCLLLRTLTPAIAPENIVWDPTQPLTHPLPLEVIEKAPKSARVAILDRTLLKSPFILRKYRKGDYFYPQGMQGKKKLSKFFKDEKYSRLEKEKQWLLCTENDIVWVIGKRVDQRFAAQDNNQNPLIIKTL